MGISVVSYTIKDIRDEEVCNTLGQIINLCLTGTAKNGQNLLNFLKDI